MEGERQLAEGRAAQLDSQLDALRSRLAERGEELAASKKHDEERMVAALARAKQQEARLREELRATGLQAERTMESREKALRQRVKGLEAKVTSDIPTPYRRCPGAAGHNARNCWMSQRHRHR